jgi:hypothetical protein
MFGLIIFPTLFLCLHLCVCYWSERDSPVSVRGVIGGGGVKKEKEKDDNNRVDRC